MNRALKSELQLETESNLSPDTDASADRDANANLKEAQMNPLVCPLCGEANGCSYAAGAPHSECWCNQAVFPEGVFDRIPTEQRRKSCICQTCLVEFKARG
ncbi:cysteine-rich CWC family protein [Paenibacillus tundrae]|uniref:Cysteine-rich CWC family protein n=1 Tax=Paenibacillus tundrae TaxID=528187 RepID=A0ABT9WCU1_9BACL|nr:cysteine-rich CWC family protein [Paenibacillus tundrae]MDQ0171067.1 hypothetical protein [Paenibacillus tundrae]